VRGEGGSWVGWAKPNFQKRGTVSNKVSAAKGGERRARMELKKKGEKISGGFKGKSTFQGKSYLRKMINKL